MKPSEQIYSNYKPEDFLVWRTLYNQQMQMLKGKVSEEFLEAVAKLKISADKIPNFEEINETLKPITGWGIHVVPNMTPQKEFFEFLARKKFTATCWIRPEKDLAFSEDPDMFHDLFGHVPLLSIPAYCHFFQGMGELAMEYIDNPLAIELHGRLYWFTIETGLIKEKNEMKIYGTAIISSSRETEYSLSGVSPKFDFDIYNIFNTNFNPYAMQTQYFVIHSFQQLQDCLEETKELLPMLVAVYETQKAEARYKKAS
jgi:phenylalanine-4-hydroxylase